MINNNLFYYGTSELTQDAFICYLLSFGMKEYKSTELNRCAIELIRKFGITDEMIEVTKIQRQYKKIDVLVTVNNNYKIIIEDKTFTSQHDNQISKYKKCLLDDGIDNEKIICVYYKIVEQPYTEKEAINITRKDILSVFKKYYNITSNVIFKNYVDYLNWLDSDVNSYKTVPISLWRSEEHNHTYKGFFSSLINNKIIEGDYMWDYVPNASGGFWGLWWNFIEGDDLKKCGIDSNYIKSLYLQIEDNLITVKLSKVNNDNTDYANKVRSDIYHIFTVNDSSFKKKSWRNGKHMTVGYFEYDEKNYVEKIKNAETILNCKCRI